MSSFGICYSPVDNTFSISRSAMANIVLFWFGITLLAAVHCYVYGLIVVGETTSFTESLGWFVLKWPFWIFVTPAIIRLTCEYFHHGERRGQLIKQYARVINGLTCVVSVLIGTARYFSPDHSGSVFKLTYLTFLRELPFSIAVTAALALVVYYYLSKQRQPEQPQSTATTAPHLMVNTNKGSRLVEIDNLVYFKAAGNFMELHTRDGEKFLYRSTLKQLYDTLDKDRFIKVHRSVVVNQNDVVEVKRMPNCEPVLTMSNGDDVSVSRSFAKQMREASEHATFKQAFLQQ